MKTRPFDDAYILTYSAEHIAYEIDMFFVMIEMLSPLNKIGASSVAEAKRLIFAMFEAFVIHLRNLIDFLYMDRPQPTDVVATDFCKTWQTLSIAEAVEEALCFGWIDSTLKPIDPAQFALRFSPRRRGSYWAKNNIDRVRRLIEEGKMTEAGMTVLPADFST
jgi:hypothetical protein